MGKTHVDIDCLVWFSILSSPGVGFFFKWAFPGLFLDFFFFFCWYIVSFQLIIFTMVNDDRKQKEEGRICTVVLHVIRKSQTLSENRLTAILNWKKPKPTWDLNPACPDRMPSLYHLCYHHFLPRCRINDIECWHSQVVKERIREIAWWHCLTNLFLKCLLRSVWGGKDSQVHWSDLTLSLECANGHHLLNNNPFYLKQTQLFLSSFSF